MATQMTLLEIVEDIIINTEPGEILRDLDKIGEHAAACGREITYDQACAIQNAGGDWMVRKDSIWASWFEFVREYKSILDC